MLRFTEIIDTFRCLTSTDLQRSWTSKYWPYVFLLQKIVQVVIHVQISSKVW